ncbi:MAG: metal ABC transporter permease [Campylobacteraceae bacterium]|jgi:zinc transport system permease protein|nr:metal ABC transporter permease [Campylobacteraceae bacterium]
MIEALSFQFMQNALIAGILVSIACGIVGSLIVVNRMVFIAGGIAHGAYGGLGLSLFLGISPLFGALGFSVALSALIAFLTYANKERTDAVIGAVWAFGMAVGIIFSDISKSYNTDLTSFLFGAILSVSKGDLQLMAAVCILIILMSAIFYKEFLAISFDMEFAKLQGLSTRVFYTGLLIMTALCIVACIRAVGLILVVALLSIPPYIAEKFCVRLSQMMILSSILSASFTLSGLVLAYAFDLTSGASIILVASLAFFIVKIYVHRRKFY